MIQWVVAHPVLAIIAGLVVLAVIIVGGWMACGYIGMYLIIKDKS